MNNLYQRLTEVFEHSKNKIQVKTQSTITK